MMIEKYLIGMLGIISLMIGWVFVQSWWRKIFAGNQSDQDVLAGRSDCGSCGCTTSCSNKLIKNKT